MVLEASNMAKATHFRDLYKNRNRETILLKNKTTNKKNLFVVHMSSLKEWWGPKSNGLIVMYINLAVFFTGFVFFLVLWLLDEAKVAPEPYYSSWQGMDQGLERYFGLNIQLRQFLTYNASFEVVGVEDVDVSGDFITTLPGPPPVKIKWIRSSDVNLATIIIDVDSPAQRTIQLYRLTLQSLTPAFNSVQQVPGVPKLFNAFY